MKTFKILTLVGLACTSLALTSAALGAGADIKHSGLSGSPIAKYGPVGGIHAYALGSNTCNVGDATLSWVNHFSPGLAMNAYSLHDGRLTQIGLGNAKAACCVANSNSPAICGTTCTSHPAAGLDPGCLDTYSAGFNGGQSNLAPRSIMNPQTGAFGSYPSTTGNAIFRRMQIAQAAMEPATFPGALYFVEGHYICTEDAAAGNDLNNASYGRVTVNATFNLAPTGTFNVGTPGIYAWRDHGLGANMPDPSVTILNVDVPNEGRFIVGHKVTDNGDNTWRYEYAIYNFNSDRAGGGFHVPIPAGATVTGVGFHSPDYHSDDGAVYSNADWVVPDPAPAYEVRWNSPQSHAENPNTNALRWGTLYNFWFTCDRAPVEGHVELDLFKPAAGCVPTTMSIAASVPAADCVGDVVRDGDVNVDDLVAVILGWGSCKCSFNCPADITGKTGEVDVDDLVTVILEWGACE